MRFPVSISVLFIIISCNNDVPDDPSSISPFTVVYKQLDIDTPIRSVALYKNFYILLHDNNKFSILDSNFNVQRGVEKGLYKNGDPFMWQSNDTVFVGYQADNSTISTFYLSDSFSLKPYQYAFSNRKPDFYGQIFLEDSVYQIYGCCAGEFGGSLWFYNKRDKRLFFYNAGCVDQVIRHRNAYHVTSNLYSASYARILNPEQLTELRYKDRLFSCNWWVNVDSLKQERKINGVTEYYGTSTEECLNSFRLNDTLFSIIGSDSVTYLAMHESDSLKRFQVLINKPLWFHHTEFFDIGDKRVVGFSAMATQSDRSTMINTHLTNSGFVVIKGRKIEIAHYPTKVETRSE